MNKEVNATRESYKTERVKFYLEYIKTTTFVIYSKLNKIEQERKSQRQEKG